MTMCLVHIQYFNNFSNITSYNFKRFPISFGVSRNGHNVLSLAIGVHCFHKNSLKSATKLLLAGNGGTKEISLLLQKVLKIVQ